MTDNTQTKENTYAHQIIELDYKVDKDDKEDKNIPNIIELDDKADKVDKDDKDDKNIPNIAEQISPTCGQDNEFIDMSFDIRDDILEYTLDID